MSSGGRKRVLLITPDFPPLRGGIQLLVHRLAERLSIFDAMVVTSAPRQDGASAETGGLEVLRVNSLPILGRRSANARMNWVAIREAIRERPDAVLCAHINCSPAGRAIATGLGVPYMLLLYGDEVTERPRMARLAVRGAAAIVAISKHTRDLALRFGADERELFVVPPGADPPLGSPRERFNQPTVIVVSRLDDRYKGHDVLIAAMRIVRERIPDARLVVVGDGRLRLELEQLADSLALAEAVQFLGYVSREERDSLLRRSHVFAMPSRLPPGGGGEGFGIVFTEAGACGLPVIGGNVAGTRDAIQAGETGLLVDPTDPRALAEAITEILTDSGVAQRLGRVGEQRAKKLTWERMAVRVERLLQHMAEGPRAGHLR